MELDPIFSTHIKNKLKKVSTGNFQNFNNLKACIANLTRYNKDILREIFRSESLNTVLKILMFKKITQKKKQNTYIITEYTPQIGT